jgi:hypothetical protein
VEWIRSEAEADGLRMIAEHLVWSEAEAEAELLWLCIYAYLAMPI